MLQVVSVVGARPNFVKLAPVAAALRGRSDVRHTVVHSGQHYDIQMSRAFFDELEIPPPDFNLEVGSGSHAQQTAAVLARFESVCEELHPDWVLVYGDVNSTVAAALTAVKLGVRVAHVEAGLRSYDRSMPEEHNRVLTDHLADLLFAPSRDAVTNLQCEGIPPRRIAFVGNVMIDSLVRALPRALALNVPTAFRVEPKRYVVATLHRPSNVDDPHVFVELCQALGEISRQYPVIFPVHPRSRRRLEEWKLTATLARVHVTEPVTYLKMLGLITSAAFVITDSGGVQEETTYLGVPCLTVRANTERPVTVDHGTNRLVVPSREALLKAALDGGYHQSAKPQLERWDGQAAVRLVGALLDGTRFD